jgi:hypothetical protein
LGGIYEDMVKTIIPIRKSMKYTLLFLVLSKYTIHIRDMIRDLSHHNIFLPESKNPITIRKEKTVDEELILCMNVFKNKLEHMSLYYGGILKSVKIVKLGEQKNKKKEDYKLSNPEQLHIVN